MSIDRLAPTRVTILVEGGSAADRAAGARALHDRSPRSAEPFATLDCAVRTAAEIEPFLGAPMSQRGRRALRVVGQGTLYVANVDAMPACLQPRFLGLLDIEVRPRIVVCTQIDLADAVRAGSFRRDLAERLLLVRLLIARPSSSR